MKASAVNLATFANALCHRNATPLSVAVLAPCAWGENLACGGAWQSVVNSATDSTATNSVWQTFADKTAHDKFGLASVAKWCLQAKQSVATRQIQHGENGAVFGRGTSLSLSLSLLALFGTPLR